MRLSLVACACTVALIACGTNDKTNAGGSGETGGTIVIDVPGDPPSMLPPLAFDAASRAVSDLLFDRLADIPLDMSTIGDKGWTPRLAKSWTWAPDSLSIAFTIDPRARWHDGKPVTAADVRYTYQINVDPKLGAKLGPGLVANIDSVSVRDSATAVVWYKKRRPEQFYDFVYQVPIVPQHVFGSTAPAELTTAEVARHPIGSGQFRFVRWDAGARYELIADTANYRGRPKLDRLIFTVVREPAVQTTQVLGGQADFMESVPIDQLSKFDSSSVARTTPVPSYGYSWMSMNAWDPKVKNRPHRIFADKNVRIAISMGLDRAAMLQNVFGKYGHVGLGPFPHTISSADSTLRLPPFDVARAARLLDSAGWKEPSPGAVRVKNGVPLRFGLLAPTTSVPRLRYAVLIQEQLRKIGAQVDVENVDMGAVFIPRKRAADFDAILDSWFTDPSVGGAKEVWATSAIGGEGQNALRYSNRTVDALLDSALMQFDQAKARTYSSRAYQTIVDDVPAVWLYDVVFFAGHHKRLVLTPMRPDGWHNFLADWSIPQNQRIDRDRIGLRAAKP